MLCNKCGNELNEDARICDFCGNSMGNYINTTVEDIEETINKRKKKDNFALYLILFVLTVLVVIICIGLSENKQLENKQLETISNCKGYTNGQITTVIKCIEPIPVNETIKKELQINDLNTSSEINEENAEPIAVSNNFKEDTNQIYVTGYLENVSSDIELKAIWLHKNSGNKIEGPSTTVNEDSKFYFYLEREVEKTYPVGDYDVSIYANNELLKSISFNVSKKDIVVEPTQISDLQVASEIDLVTSEPITVTDKFKTDSAAIYIVGTVRNVKEPVIIRGTWIHLNSNSMLEGNPLQIDYDRWFNFSLTNTGEGLTKGDYALDIYINDVKSNTINFTVE